MTTTPEKLATMIILAEEAHAVHEQVLGHRDAEWAKWYAAYILKHWPEHFK